MHTQPRRTDDTCHITINETIILNGNLRLPPHPRGVVIFAHGSGSSRFSPRNQFVARVLQRAGFATLLLDLLTAQEETLDQAHAHLRFNIPLLSSRVQAATRWLLAQSACAGLSIGYFGASTGAAAALVAAAKQPEQVAAVVSRGGRPDLADAALEHVQAPTLLIVGSRDEQVIELNEEALARLHVEKHLELVPNATHLFEEPGTLEQVADLAQQWFARYLPPARREVHEQHLS
ncbi:dienelactone hydrolase family protein [Ktedonospora formicarum]|uniref:DeoR family transcriptional regulator n=1 Tax=Ktedonospora formicarum TaxID=2778364 RepID=A0A8J3HXK9_9CHLR|nr:dienelactone hydrolase family protein [Ktedonospora formicarum]GHO42423.1 DeoR family transcriptional regulator [Ktedonospora formicarum]